MVKKKMTPTVTRDDLEPVLVAVWSEWWAWEVAVLMAGWLCEGRNAGADCSELVVQPALGNTMVIGFMVHFGFSLAVSGDTCPVLCAFPS